MTRARRVLVASSLTLACPFVATAQPVIDMRDAGALESEPMPGLLPEGSFIVRQFGTMRRVGAAGWVFIFAPNVDGPNTPPMPLLPCANLQAMEQIAGPAGDAGRDAGFLVSGQVFVFDGRNYLLPTIFVQADGPDPVVGAEEETGGSEGARAPEAPVADPFGEAAEAEPTIEELLARIEEASQAAPTGEAAPQFAPSAEGLIPEGTLVASRRGRVMRSDLGGWRFTPDVDTDTPPGVDQPMDLMPCRTLEAMLREQWTIGSRAFLVGGRVFIYNGRNYLLPAMFVIERPERAGLTTGQ